PPPTAVELTFHIVRSPSRFCRLVPTETSRSYRSRPMTDSSLDSGSGRVDTSLSSVTTPIIGHPAGIPPPGPPCGKQSGGSSAVDDGCVVAEMHAGRILGLDPLQRGGPRGPVGCLPWRQLGAVGRAEQGCRIGGVADQNVDAVAGADED